MGSTERRPSQQRSTARTILFTSAGSSEPLRLRTCICDGLDETGNGTTDWAVPTRTGVAINAFSATDREKDMNGKMPKTPVHRQPPLGGSHDSPPRVRHGYWQAFALSCAAHPKIP